jgi:hypothetical protein
MITCKDILLEYSTVQCSTAVVLLVQSISEEYQAALAAHL